MINALGNLFIRMNYYRFKNSMQSPLKVQAKTLQYVIRANKRSIFTNRVYKFVDNESKFQSLKVTQYKDYEPTVTQYLANRNHASSEVYFATSSGTSGKPKYVPYAKEQVDFMHIRPSWFSLGILQNHLGYLKVFSRKNLFVPGAIRQRDGSKVIGDISAIIVSRIPTLLKRFYYPQYELAVSPDYEWKIEHIAQDAAKRSDIYMTGGVPTWNLALLKRVLDLTGKKSIGEVWPELTIYQHGGVNFDPYDRTLHDLVGRKIYTHEIYNSTEGFFAIQDTRSRKDGLALVLNCGVYFEFLTLHDYQSGDVERIIPLSDVEQNRNYVLLISTINGFFRYIVGDTVRFTSTKPYRIVVSGRTEQYINAFGEDLVESDATKALTNWSKKNKLVINNFTVAPLYISYSEKGSHEWIIETDGNVPYHKYETLVDDLDDCLQKTSKNYSDKRQSSFGIIKPKVTFVKQGTFDKWVKEHGGLGAQRKVPKLSNNRTVINQILDIHDD